MRRLVTALFGPLLIIGSVFLLADVAGAQAYPGGTTEERTNRDPGDKGDVAGTKAEVRGATIVRGQNLAVTGGDILALTAIGATMVGAGVVLVRRSRRTAPAQAA